MARSILVLWRVRQILVAAILASAIVLLLSQLLGHHPAERWLMPKYLKAIAAALFLTVAIVASGLAVVERLRPGLPLRERLVFALAVGTHTYYLLQLLGGLLGWFGAVWAGALPICMLAFGLFGTRTTLRRVWRKKRRLSFSFGIVRSWQAPLAALGLFAILALYLGILTPRNAAFDSLWYHLGLGEGWAAEGGIRRSPEGWFMASLPDLAAVLYSWGFLLPGFDLFEELMVAAHLEFFLFLGTLASIPTAVRALLPRTNVAISWVVLFAFPAIFLYDAGLHSGNDHIAATFAIPTFLALRRVWNAPSPSDLLLLALGASAALLTKYQAASIASGPLLIASARLLQLAMRGRDAGPFVRRLGVLTGSVLAFTAPMWLRNLIWYGDPLYPALHGHLDLRPFTKEAASYMDVMWRVNVWRPEGSLIEQLLETVKKGFTFSFESHAHERFHGEWPYVGSLFTLSLLWLPFVPGAKRALGLAACAQLGILVWYFLSHVERYLQILMPWMAVVTAAAIVLAWRQGWVVRALVTALVAVQVWWGSDAVFIRSHAMLNELPALHTARLIESGFKKDDERRRDVAGSLQRIGERLPDGSRILLHDENARIGLRHSVVQDKPRYNGLIAYGELNSAGEVFDLYHGLGITHVVWRKSSVEYSTLSADFRFFEFAENALSKEVQIGSFFVAEMPRERPRFPGGDVVLHAGCARSYAPGLYHLRDLDLIDRPRERKRGFENLPASTTERERLLDRVRYLAYGKTCNAGLPYPVPGFVKVATRKEDEEVWVRRW